MKVRRFTAWDFLHVGRIEPERTTDGVFLELMPQARYVDAATAPLHAYGSGPFCRFQVGRGRREPGLYVLTVDHDPVYAGECLDLSQRWGPNGYGCISPRNCFRGGQPTNCRVNALILAAAKARLAIDIWFHNLAGDTTSRRAAETQLIQSLKPSWNRAKMGAATDDNSKTSRGP
jgi:hypothetical protein